MGLVCWCGVSVYGALHSLQQRLIHFSRQINITFSEKLLKTLKTENIFYVRKMHETVCEQWMDGGVVNASCFGKILRSIKRSSHNLPTVRSSCWMQELI